MENKFFDAYFALWGLVLPITSILVFPSIQGTTPAYLFAMFAILFVPLVSKVKGRMYLLSLIYFFFFFIAFVLVSQCALVFVPYLNFDQLRLVNPLDRSVILRGTLFTQSLYLVAGVSTFAFVKVFYTPKWDRFIFRGAVILGVYGIYEIIFFQLFHENGDFLSNRTFGDNELGSGSLFQTMALGPLEIMRLKSLTGEPSMFAFTMLPLWIYAIHKQVTFVCVFLFVTLILSTSTTMILGMLIYGLGRVYYTGLRDKGNIRMLLLTLIAGIALNVFAGDYVDQAINDLVTDKITLSSFSGFDRFDSFDTSVQFFMDAPFLNQLFGIGFGVIRSTDMFSTLLVNTGVLGLIFTTGVFFYPIYKLGDSDRGIGLKLILLVIYLTMMFSVSEFAYLTIWLFLGIAYNELKTIKGECRCSQSILMHAS